jgi:hypothetical protein
MAAPAAALEHGKKIKILLDPVYTPAWPKKRISSLILSFFRTPYFDISLHSIHCALSETPSSVQKSQYLPY